VNNAIEVLLARAQIGLALIFSMGFFALLFVMILYHKDLTSTELTIITSMLSVLATVLTSQMAFFFSRSRPTGIPDGTGGQAPLAPFKPESASP
jgi:hypothetical protein